MNNYYTLQHLTKYCKLKLQDLVFVAARTSKRNMLELYFHSNNESVRVVFSTIPGQSALFLDEHSFSKSSNTKSFFEELVGSKVQHVTMAENDRYITVHFDNGYQLTFLVYSNHANVVLSDTGILLGAFKKNKFSAQHILPAPAPASEPWQLIPKNLKTEENRHQLPELVHQLLHDPEPAWVEGSGFTLASETFLKGERIQRYPNVNQGVRDAWFRIVVDAGFRKEREAIKKRLQSVTGSLREAVSRFGNAEPGWDRYEKFGHLLMSNQHREGQRDPGALLLDDYFNENNQVSIPLKPDMSIVENAGWYYQRAKDSKKNYLAGAQKIKGMLAKLDSLNEAAAGLDEVTHSYALAKWKKKYGHAVLDAGFTTAAGEQLRMPYRKMNFKGFEIWVGKNASGNDEVLKNSHKEDIWLHARSVSGSHVIIRMNKKTGLPDKEVLEYAASIAAFFSKLKGSSSVPVIFTKRKYVRKPKGGAPGLVVVEREQVVLTDPQNPMSISDQNDA